MALEAGKPLKAARIEVERAIFTFAVAAEESVRIAGEVLPMDLQAASEDRWGLVRRFPLGPISAITPFNFPLNLVAHKIAPAMAAGCSVVLKPAPQTPFCALMLGELVRQAGWPAGALSIVPLPNEEADALICDRSAEAAQLYRKLPGWMAAQGEERQEARSAGIGRERRSHCPS